MKKLAMSKFQISSITLLEIITGLFCVLSLVFSICIGILPIILKGVWIFSFFLVFRICYISLFLYIMNSESLNIHNSVSPYLFSKTQEPFCLEDFPIETHTYCTDYFNYYYTHILLYTYICKYWLLSSVHGPVHF